MTELTLRPWRFSENENVELYWLGAPYKESPGQWMIPAIFRRPNGSYKEEVFPWGTLPSLIPGRKYVNGTIRNEDATGREYSIQISPSTRFSLCKGFDIPRPLYPFWETIRYGYQLLCRFMISGTIIYLPCTEILRSIIAPYSALLNRLFEPRGMDNLLGSYIEHDFGIEIELTGEYPEALLKEDIISYFVWLNFDKKASTEWDSVYLRMFDRAMIDFPGQFERGFKEGIPLEAYPPLSTREHWRCRGLKLYNRILVLEILERRGIIAPYSRIVCHSPKFISVETDRKPVTPRGETEDTGDIPAFVLDETVKAADKGAEPRRISNPNTLFRFVNKPKVVKVRSKTQIRHKGESCDTGDNFRQPSEKTNRNDDTVSTRTRFPGGSIRSAEFVPLIDTATFPEGFSDFKKALDILQDKNWDWNVQVTFRNCETSSIIERDRVCAIVHISSGSIGSRFIFEFNRLEYSSSSTLIVIPSWGYADRYESVDKHLSIVVKNSFHWNIYRLRQNREFEYLLLRHVTGQTVEAWAERLIKKLIY